MSIKFQMLILQYIYYGKELYFNNVKTFEVVRVIYFLGYVFSGLGLR